MCNSRFDDTNVSLVSDLGLVLLGVWQPLNYTVYFHTVEKSTEHSTKHFLLCHSHLERHEDEYTMTEMSFLVEFVLWCVKWQRLEKRWYNGVTTTHDGVTRRAVFHRINCHCGQDDFIFFAFEFLWVMLLKFLWSLSNICLSIIHTQDFPALTFLMSALVFICYYFSKVPWPQRQKSKVTGVTPSSGQA